MDYRKGVESNPQEAMKRVSELNEYEGEIYDFGLLFQHRVLFCGRRDHFQGPSAQAGGFGPNQ
jgi:hypothetical protein